MDLLLHIICIMCIFASSNFQQIHKRTHSNDGYFQLKFFTFEVILRKVLVRVLRWFENAIVVQRMEYKRRIFFLARYDLDLPKYPTFASMLCCIQTSSTPYTLYIRYRFRSGFPIVRKSKKWYKWGCRYCIHRKMSKSNVYWSYFLSSYLTNHFLSYYKLHVQTL